MSVCVDSVRDIATTDIGRATFNLESLLATSSLVVHDDSSELVGVEAGAADERPVDVGLGHELGDVGGLHRTAVLDAHAAGGLVAPPLTHSGADEATDGL